MPNTFVRVSGYGQDDLNDAVQRGIDTFLSTSFAEAKFGMAPYLETKTTNTYTMFTDKSVPNHSILLISISAATTNASSSSNEIVPQINLTVTDGTARQIGAYSLNGYKANELDTANYVWLFEVTAGAKVSCTFQVTGRNSNATLYAGLIHV